ncbi:MAG: stage V sporulation protein T [Lachnotalea sp.]
MKATGIVRRIDDLGRVVIPKEIRRTLRIREGDPLEIFTDREGEIILKKYSPIGELGLFAKQYAEVLAQTSGHVVCISDRDQIIAIAGGSKKDFIGKNISKQLDDAINEREVLTVALGEKQYLNIINEEMEEYASEVVAPILCEGDAIGAVIILCKDKSGKTEKVEQKLAIAAAAFLGKQMEN